MMRHKHTMLGAALCRWIPCRARRAATRDRDARRRAAALAQLQAEIDDERMALYDMLDDSDGIGDYEDPLLVNFARNGGTRHGAIRRVHESFGDRNPCVRCPRFGDTFCCSAAH